MRNTVFVDFIKFQNKEIKMNPIDIENACDLIRQIIRDGNSLCENFPNLLKGKRLTDNDIYDNIYGRVVSFYAFYMESEGILQKLYSEANFKLFSEDLYKQISNCTDAMNSFMRCLSEVCEEYCLVCSSGNTPDTSGFDSLERIFCCNVWIRIEQIYTKILFALIEIVTTPLQTGPIRL